MAYPYVINFEQNKQGQINVWELFSSGMLTANRMKNQFNLFVGNTWGNYFHVVDVGVISYELLVLKNTNWYIWSAMDYAGLNNWHLYG